MYTSPAPLAAPAFSLCVFCGSRSGENPHFAQAAQAVGQWIGQHGGQLVYGGGNNGLMGLLADAALDAGASVVGVIPQSLEIKEHAKRECTELHVVPSMHRRKQLMAERADAFLILPGGIGTLEEWFEVWSWRQLGYHDKPIGVLNVGGFYDPMLAALGQSAQAGFMDTWQLDLIQISSSIEALLPALVQNAGFAAPDRLEQI
ncbi:predicted Rossmann fold nucleotide-binding protein [Serpentinimonas raichei]|uniref:Cytokinin riboside 5'-monophosphate phosphoribohydrolase n=1 Tax=Serpentinimonas raichei TaxID=1458425 RepID=A0A060NPJ9_9BURK|nr:TIGR00730 family Rossman fold protein [Serpentinimonas raichei]BAO81438.1 predicted Rossmann fold nucleotide-binding protein [Serpentinimonas raichei]